MTVQPRKERSAKVAVGRVSPLSVVVGGAVVIALVGLALVAIDQRHSAEKEVIEQFDRFQHEQVERIASAVHTSLDLCGRELNEAAGYLAEMGDPANARRYRELFGRLSSSRCGPLTVLDDTGSVVFHSRSELPGFERLLPDIWEWAQRSEARGESYRLFGPFASPTQEGEALDKAVFLLAAPTFRDVGDFGLKELAGAALFQLDLAFVLGRAGERLERFGRSKLWAIDEKGVLLWHSGHPEMVLRSPAQARAEWDEGTCSSCHKSFTHVDEMLETGKGTRTIGLVDRPSTLVTYAPMSFVTSRWLIALSTPKDAITDAHRRSLGRSVMLLLLAFIVVGAGIALVYRSYRHRVKAEDELRHVRSRETLERRLRESQQRYRSMIESAHDLILTTDREGRVFFVNPRVATVSGRSVSRWEGVPLERYFLKGDQAVVRRAVEMALAGDETSLEARLLTRDDEVLILAMEAVALQDEDKVLGMVIFARDVTAQKRAEAENASRAERERTLNALLRIGLSERALDEKLAASLQELGLAPGLNSQPGWSIHLIDEANAILTCEASVSGADIGAVPCRDQPLGGCLCSRAALEGRGVSGRCDLHPEDLRQHEVVPIRSGGKVLGVLVCSEPPGVVQDEARGDFLELVAGTLAGVLDRDRAQAALQHSEQRYALAAEGARDGLWDWDLLGRRIYCSERWTSMLGLESNGLDNDPDAWFARVHPDDLPELRARLDAHLSGATEHFECEYRLRHENGRYLWILIRGKAVRDENDKPTRVAGSQTDISERKASEEQLLKANFSDELTGLPNRALLYDRLGRCIERRRRHSSARFAILIADLDQFNVINDSLGHVAGDQLLCDVAGRLALPIREGDTLARLGGDEFAILLDDIADDSDPARVAERLDEEVRRPYIIEGQEVFASITVGIVHSNAEYEKPEEMLRDADTALYRAKADGRGRAIVFDTEMHRDAVASLTLENDLRRAVRHEEFVLHYQPVVSLASGQIVVLEALVRWNHPTQGLLHPASFIPKAEESDCILDLGEWVLNEACVQSQEWRGEGGHDVTVAVNVSARQVVHSDLHALVLNALLSTGLDEAGLELELAESSILTSSDAHIRTLKRLSDRGISIALDDFGTGYSSLYRLRHLPIDVLKIDRAFIKGLATSAEDRAITEAVVAMAHSLDLTVTAEGVEVPSQLKILDALGCDRIQGYLLGRPMTADEVSKLLGKPIPVKDLVASADLEQ